MIKSKCVICGMSVTMPGNCAFNPICTACAVAGNKGRKSIENEVLYEPADTYKALELADVRRNWNNNPITADTILDFHINYKPLTTKHFRISGYYQGDGRK